MENVCVILSLRGALALTFILVFSLSLLQKQDNARVGDDFMNQIQSIAAYLPYMTCPGNHERA